ncbi:CS1 type fimbrial major subunit [Yersinia bercovieri]|nr:CS1 type fimbrial major subunit [Yersinia bercovieri]CNI78272.1 alpha-related fimbriae minor subunit 1 [Yersinia bercovieri]
MKKTLLSIMTMAILASSTAAYSNAVTKDITVEATIPSLFNITSTDGTPLELATLKMGQNLAGAAGDYIITHPIKLRANGDGIKITVAENLELKETKANKVFTNIAVKLNDTPLATNNPIDILKGNIEDNYELVISGKQPDNANTGEVYSGTLKLKLEPNS